MPHPVNRRQMPGWKQGRRPAAPGPARPSGFTKKSPGGRPRTPVSGPQKHG